MSTAVAARLAAVSGGLVVDRDGAARWRDMTISHSGVIRDIIPGPMAGDFHGVRPLDACEHRGLLDATGTVVMPGFVDAHEHLRSFAPGSREGEGQALPELLASSARASEAATAADYRALTALATARLARSGVTSAIDHIYPLHRSGMLAAAHAGHEAVGVRCALAVGVMTKVPDAIRSDPTDVFRLVDQAVDTMLPADRLFVAPVSLRQTDLDAYRASVRFATDRSLRLYTHISESVDEVEQCLAEHGKRPVELLASLGFLREGTVLVHCVHLNEHDISLIADSGATVVYCPTNHAWLAKGTAPVLRMRQAEIPVCLGLDGMPDPFAEYRQAIFAQGSAAGDPGALSTNDAFALGTTAAAGTVGGSGVTGSLEPGAPADFVTLPMLAAPLQPMADPVFSVLRHATAAAVRDVVVAGEPIVRDGALVRANESDLIDRAWAAITGIAERAGNTPPPDWRGGAALYPTNQQGKAIP